MQIFAFKVLCFQVQLLGVKKGCSANIFSDTKQKHVYWKICKVRKTFGCCGRISFSMSSELKFVKLLSETVL